MKKVFYTWLFLVFCMTSLNAQGFMHVGIGGVSSSYMESSKNRAVMDDVFLSGGAGVVSFGFGRELDEKTRVKVDFTAQALAKGSQDMIAGGGIPAKVSLEWSSFNFAIGRYRLFSKQNESSLFGGAYLGLAKISKKMKTLVGGIPTEKEFDETKLMLGAKFGGLIGKLETGEAEIGLDVNIFAGAGIVNVGVYAGVNF